MDRKQQRANKGLAPFASLEDLSDESPPDDKCRLALPGIREDAPVSPMSPAQRAVAGITPRIDISRASSSSHHDDSSPERELFGGTSDGGNGVKYGLGFTEEMALELRSSTEELDFHDPTETETKTRRKKLQQQQAVTKYELEAQSEKESKERKDSACSEGGLLFIGGRTSRLSSIGSAASGGSVASHVSGGSAVSGHSHLSGVSHVSGASHLSAVSNYSRASRCSSPHRMMLETSFCGPKPIPTVSLEAEYPPRESVEATLLARKSDPTGAVLPQDDSINISQSSGKMYSGKTTLEVKTSAGNPKSGSDSKHKRLSSEYVSKSQSPPVHNAQTRSSSAGHNTRPSRPKPSSNSDLVRIIPLHGSLDEPGDSIESAEIVERPPSPPEYGIYIPLKGPEIDYSKKSETTSNLPKSQKKPPIEESDLVRFISLHGDDDEELQRRRTDNLIQPNYRNGQNVHFKPWNEDSAHPQIGRDKHQIKKSRTPEPDGKCKPPTLDLTKKQGRSGQSLSQQPHGESRTPSPAASFTRGTIFRRSSDSSGSSRKSANTSGSGDSKTKKDSRNKSVFTSLFKKTTKEKDQVSQKGHEKGAFDPKFTNVEFKFKQEDKFLEGDSIIIPLHSPDSIIEPFVLMEPEPKREELDEVKLPTFESHLGAQKKEATQSKSVPQAIEKNVVVVDVINEDKESNVFKVESPKVESVLQNDMELEHFETEPKVLKSQSMNVAIEEREREAENCDNPENVEEIKETITEDSTEKTQTKVPEVENSFTQTEQEAPHHQSSESEADSEVGNVQGINCEESEEDDNERKGLFHQTDSIEEELPYVPTTLPQERSIAMPMIPVRQRIGEVKTCPIDRPRSTTPINPATLDEYAATYDETSSPNEKMQITLPRTDSIGKSKSPGRAKPWTEFAEQCLQSPKEGRKMKPPSPTSTTPPPLPPRGTAPASSWVSFDELPERRRAPKRITTLPSRTSQLQTASNIVYSYVNPEECSCECHENQGKLNNPQCPSDKGHCSYNQKEERTERGKHYRS